VIVALGVLGMLMASMGLFFLRGVHSSVELQHRQLATALGAQAMEGVSAVSALADSDGCVPLLHGRFQSAITAQWSRAPTEVDLSTTNAAWAPATCPSTVSIPLAGLTSSVPDDGTTPAVTRGGVGYTVRTYIGTCRRPLAGGTCTKTASGAATTMYRVIVTVGWRGDCPRSTCAYTLSTLVDPNPDLTFDIRSGAVPVARDDTVCTPAGTATLVSLIANDSGPLGTAPVTIVSPPAHGTLSASIVTGTGVFTPTSGYTGLDAFTYRLTSSSGVKSTGAGVTVRIGAAC
jgi:hypothetical protein